VPHRENFVHSLEKPFVECYVKNAGVVSIKLGNAWAVNGPSFIVLSDDMFKASSKTIPPHSAI